MPARRALLSPGCKSFATKMPAFQAFKKAHPQVITIYFAKTSSRPGGPVFW